jgi:hypothetical protein
VERRARAALAANRGADMTGGSPFTEAAPVTPHHPVGVQRPIAITIVCVIGIIGVLFTVPLIFSPAAADIAPWYPVVLTASALVGLACMIGLWQMRRWAVYVYTAMFAVVQLLFMASSLWTAKSLILPATVIVIMFVYLPRMR